MTQHNSHPTKMPPPCSPISYLQRYTLKNLVTKLHLTLSSKKGAGSIIASTPRLAVQIKETPKRNGINYEVETSARDLGILYTAGKANPSKSAHARLMNTKPRTHFKQFLLRNSELAVPSLD